jgi:hypothetical protein
LWKNSKFLKKVLNAAGKLFHIKNSKRKYMDGDRMRITPVAPIFPALQAQSQYQYGEKSYSPKKKKEPSFKTILEKELQLNPNTKVNLRC